jgi:hypothetical protein
MCVMNDSGSNRRHAQDAGEKAWWSEYRFYEADREFSRMRRRAVLRALASWFVRRHPAAEEPPTGDRTGREDLVAIASIVGCMGREGREVPRFPVLKRAFLHEWRQIFLAESDDADPTLAVHKGRGGWYLAGGLPALIVLEVARAKHRPLVRIAPDPRREPCLCTVIPEGGDECCAGLPPLVPAAPPQRLGISGSVHDGRLRVALPARCEEPRIGPCGH